MQEKINLAPMNVVLIHGALNNNEEFDDFVKHFREDIQLTKINLQGHGADSNPIKYSLILEQLAKDLSQLNGEYHVLGYSLGGYIALHACLLNLISPKTITTVATKLIWDNEVMEKQKAQLNEELLRIKAPEYLDKLKLKFNKPVEQVLNETLELMQEITDQQFLNPTSLAEINCKVSLCRGDKDYFVNEKDIQFGNENIKLSKQFELKESSHLFSKINLNELYSKWMELIK